MNEMKTLTINGVTYTVSDPDAAQIKDDTVGAGAWSSKNTVDKLCPAFTETGSSVTCKPVEGYPLEVTTHIALTQEGSGNPSPENIRPITLYDMDEINIMTESTGDMRAVEFGEGIACGTFDWHTGMLRQTHVALTLDGKEEWSLNNPGQLYFYHNIANCANYGEISCSHFIGSKDGAYNRQSGHISSSSEILWICDDRFTTAEELKAYLAEQYASETPVVAVLMLSTPKVTRLYPIEIPGLAGENTLSSMIGSITVSGRTALSDFSDDPFVCKKMVVGEGKAIGQSAVAGGSADQSIVRDVTGVDIATLSDSLIVKALGKGGLRLKKRIEYPAEAVGDACISYGVGSQSITAMSASAGVGAQAGSRGFYLHKVTIPADGSNITINLSTQQKPYYKYQQNQYVITGDLVWKEANADARTWDDAAAEELSKWEAGDEVNIILKKGYFLCGQIVTVDSAIGDITVSNTGAITAEDLADAIEFKGSSGSINANTAFTALVPYQFTVNVPTRPEVGVKAIHFGATATGIGSVAAGTQSQSHGKLNVAAGPFGFVVGQDNATGYGAFACGESNLALGINSHVEGYLSKAYGDGAHVQGKEGIATKKASYAHVEGMFCQASEHAAHAEGYYTVASGRYAHAEGGKESSDAAGSTAAGTYSHAEGRATQALASGAHTEGRLTTATKTANYAHAEGMGTKVEANAAHAEGNETVASGPFSHAEGNGTLARGNSQHVQGKYNVEDTANKYAHIIGNGTSTKRSNAHTVDWEGNAWYAGHVEATHMVLLSPNGTRFAIKVDDDGTLTTEKVTD